jgi:hypothetical protein
VTVLGKGVTDQIGIVGESLVGAKIPVFRISESFHMAVQKNKVGSVIVQIRMDIIL